MNRENLWKEVNVVKEQVTKKASCSFLFSVRFPLKCFDLCYPFVTRDNKQGFDLKK